MSRLSIYVEGGGDKPAQKEAFRQGMDGLLHHWKEAARIRHWRWRLVPCGGRRNAYDSFRNARNNRKEGETIILLVDAEAAVTGPSRREHLRLRPGDEWDLGDVPEEDVHLMVQCMEAWIVADPEALAAFYGPGFRTKALPSRPNLEDEPKMDCIKKLQAAVSGTTKRSYEKINHGAPLLGRISTTKIKARCRPHAAAFFDALDELFA